MPTAHLIHGYIGCGKTTFAASLEARLPAVRFSSDEWVAELFSSSEGEVPDFGAVQGAVEALLERIWTRCLVLGVDVVLDLGFWSHAKRDRVRLVVDSVGGQSVLYSLACSDDVAWSRVEQRNRNLRGSVEISRNAFEVLRDKFEPLGPDEAHITIRTEREGSARWLSDP